MAQRSKVLCQVRCLFILLPFSWFLIVSVPFTDGVTKNLNIRLPDENALIDHQYATNVLRLCMYLALYTVDGPV